MKCVRCGKRIPYSTTKMCEKCKKNLIHEIQKEEFEGVQKRKIDSSKFNVGEIIFIIICACIIVYSISYSAYTLIKRKKIVDDNTLSTTHTLIGNTIGNTIANIRYYGYCAIDGDWVYYHADNEDFSKSRICRVKTNGAGKSIVFEDSNMEIYSINALNGYLYFTGIINGAYSDLDQLDNKIYRMKEDGSDLDVINDNNFSNNIYNIFVIQDKIYFVGTDENIYRMNLDGTNIEQLANNRSGFLGVNDKYILYDQRVDEEKNVTYIMNLDGSNPRAVLEGQRLYHVNIENNYVYFLDENQYIYRTKIDSNIKEDIHLGKVYLLNVYNNYAYYFDYIDEENLKLGIYRIDLLETSKEPELVKAFSKLSYYMDVVGDFVNYLDSNDNFVSLNLLKTDGSLKNIQLFTYDIEDVKKIYGEDSSTIIP